MLFSKNETGTTEYYRELDGSYHTHPFNNNKSLREEGVRVIERGEACHVWDTAGKRYLDGMAGLWSINVGYGRQELSDIAASQMTKLPFYNTFFKSTTPQAALLSKKLAELAPTGLNHSFFACSGSEANDSIIKFARFYWRAQGQPTKKIMIARDMAYHGSTMAAASLTGLKGMHPQFGLPLAGFEHVPTPYWFRDGRDQSPEEFGRQCALALEHRIQELGPDNVAAFFTEPVQAAGGVIVPPAGYWEEIQRICKEYNVLLIADEVVCGFGRTGNWFGCNTFNIEPDFMTLAKGITSSYLPLSAVMIHDSVIEVLDGTNEAIEHGFTHGGHPVACAVALENIRLLEEEGIVEKVANDTGPYLQAALQMIGEHPLIGNIRGLGMIGAFEIVKDKNTLESFDAQLGVAKRLQDICYANGLILRAVGQSMAVSPPLVITREEIDELANTALACLDILAEEISTWE